MDIITDEYSRQRGKEALAKYNKRRQQMSYNFAPDTLAKFTVTQEDINDIAPPRNATEYLQRIENNRVKNYETQQTKQVMNQQADLEIVSIKELLKNPRLVNPNELFEKLKVLENSKLDNSDPQLVKKQEIINTKIENLKRDTEEVRLNHGFGMKRIVDELRESNRNQQEAIKKFGSIQRAIAYMEVALEDETAKKLQKLSEGVDVEEVYEDFPPPEIHGEDVVYPVDPDIEAEILQEREEAEAEPRIKRGGFGKIKAKPKPKHESGAGAGAPTRSVDPYTLSREELSKMIQNKVRKGAELNKDSSNEMIESLNKIMRNNFRRLTKSTIIDVFNELRD